MSSCWNQVHFELMQHSAENSTVLLWLLQNWFAFFKQHEISRQNKDCSLYIHYTGISSQDAMFICLLGWRSQPNASVMPTGSVLQAFEDTTVYSSLEELDGQPHYNPGTMSRNYHQHAGSSCKEPAAIQTQTPGRKNMLSWPWHQPLAYIGCCHDWQPQLLNIDSIQGALLRMNVQ